MKKSSFNIQTGVITLFYFIVLLILQLVNGWYENFSDAVHYLWISDKYAEADWKNAINTYWGPMISWLLLVLKPIIHEPFLRFRILQIILGWLALYFTNKILKKRIDPSHSLLLTIVMIPLIVSFAWFYLTPDLLLLVFVLILLNFLETQRERDLRTAVQLAAIGACMFYVKSVGLYFFILLILGRFIFKKKDHNLRTFTHYLQIALILIVFCAPWFFLISAKHGSFTLGTSTSYNYKINSPRITPDLYGEVGNPYHLGTLTEPNPKNAFDAFVEHAHQPYLSWEGMGKSEIFSYYLKIIYKNLKSARSMFFGIDIGSMFILLFLAGVFIARQSMKGFLKRNLNYILIFTANVILYLPFFFMDRYTWPGLISLFFLSIFLLFTIPAFRKPFIVLSATFVIFMLNVFTIYKEISYTLPEKPITEAIWNTKQNLDIKRSIWLCNKDDKRLGLIKGLIYYNKGQYLGALFYENNTPETLSQQYQKFGINTIVTLEDCPDSLLFSPVYEFQPLIKSKNLSVYRINKK